ncbi:hypothetical protein FI667_g13421, partial [Globisporangium splendens]
MVYKRVTLDITPAQLRKAADGKQITLTATQLKGSGATFHVHPANHEKIMKAKRAGRGTRVYIAPGAVPDWRSRSGSLSDSGTISSTGATRGSFRKRKRRQASWEVTSSSGGRLRLEDFIVGEWIRKWRSAGNNKNKKSG